MAVAVKLITGPTAEPLSLAAAKRRLRVTTDAEDSAIEDLIAEARAQAEDECGRAFMPQTLSLFLDRFPRQGGAIEIPLPPLQSVTFVKYFDVDGDFVTLDPGAYHVAAAGEPGRIVPNLAAGGYWPTTETGKPEAVEIRYVAGYASAAAVPRQALAAINAIVADRHINPDGGDRPIPPAARRSLDALDVRGFGWNVPLLREGW